MNLQIGNSSMGLRLILWIGWICLLICTSSVAACAMDRAAEPTATSDNTDQAIIITVRTVLSVDDVTTSSERLRGLIQEHQGLIANANVYGSPQRRMADFEVHIPAGKVQDFRSALLKLGQLDSESEHLEDVTAPRTDLDARLQNARVQEKRLLELLQEKSGTLSDVISIEKEIAAVRENIERMEAEKRILDHRISLATLHVSLRPKHTNLWANPVDAIISALGTGLRGARNLVVGSAVVGATILPSVLVLAGLILLLFLVARGLLRWRARRPIATP